MESTKTAKTLSKYLRLNIYQYLDPIKDVAVKIGSLSKNETELITESHMISGRHWKLKKTPVLIPIRFLRYINELSFGVNYHNSRLNPFILLFKTTESHLLQYLGFE